MFSESRANCVAWLTLLDQTLYQAAWDEGGALLKDIISRREWIAAMNAIRKPMGYNSSRKVSSQRVLDVLPFGTKGYFMQINFTSSFWGKGSATENCILMYDRFSNWRVISYGVQ